VKDEVLNALAQATVNELLRKIKSGEATAADLNVARQLLKDSGIEFGDSKSAPVRVLTDALPFASVDQSEFN
jgi:hypothetical protein